MIVGVDIDCVVVRSDLAWLEWLNQVCGEDETPFTLGARYGGEIPYDLSECFILPKGVRALDFWKSPILYDNLHPVVESKYALEKIHNAGHEIVFISSIKGQHGKSKHNFIKRHFPYASAVIYTREKHYVGVDVMFDDRLDILEEFDSNVYVIQVDTPYSQSSRFKPNMKTSWESILHNKDILPLFEQEQQLEIEFE